MNKKMKGIIVASLILAVAASVIYATPVIAYMNGATDQTRDMDQDRLRDQTCDCDCDGLQAQSRAQDRTQLRQQDCVQNQTCDGSSECQQYRYQYRFRYQNTSTP